MKRQVYDKALRMYKACILVSMECTTFARFLN